MADWTTISDTAIAVQRPAPASQGRALRDNPIAIAENAIGAPLIQGGWIPYNMTEAQEVGKTGLFYDVAVSGARAAIGTPTFVDGFEYMILATRVSSSSGVADDIELNIFSGPGSAFSPVVVGSTSGPAGSINFQIEFPLARVPHYAHFAEIMWSTHGASSGIATRKTAYASLTAGAYRVYEATFTTSSAASIDAGQFYLYKRGDYGSQL